jgi:toxin FitB
MIVLDTNVLSAIMRTEADPNITKWLDLQPRDSVWITTVTLMELRFGILTLAFGQRQESLSQALSFLLEEKIQGRIAPFDAEAADSAALLMAERKRKGRPMEIRDALIAGIVLSRRAILATRNTVHFSDLGPSVVNPGTGNRWDSFFYARPR